MIKKRFSHYTCCKLQDLGGQENLRKMDAKMVRKNDQNGTKFHPDARFLRFWGVLGGGVFSTFFGTGKSRPKIRKNPEKKQPARGQQTRKMGRPGGMRGASGEVRRGLEPLRVRQESGQESKT